MSTAAVLLPLLVFVIFLDSPLFFFALASLVIVLAALELCALAEQRGARPQRSLCAAGAVLVASTFLPGGPDLALALALCVIAAPLAWVLSRRPFSEGLVSMSTALLGVLLVGFLLGHTVGLRCAPGVGRHLLLYLLWVVWCSDTVAYAVGTRFGRTPLAPRLSPRKTWEGTIAGLGAALLAAAVGREWFLPDLRWSESAALGVLLGALALAGDLCESLLKRGSEVKDSAGLLPGHGGLLDRTDSLMFTAPFLYHYWRWFHA